MTTHVVTSEEAAEVKSEVSEVAASAGRPNWLPEKFKSAEDMAKAYAELESKQGSGENKLPSEIKSEDEAAASTDEAPKDGDEESSKEAEGDIPENPYGESVGKVMTEAGIDPKALATEWQDKGEINEDTRAKLDAAFGKDMVDQYIAGWQSNQAGDDKSPNESIEKTPVGPTSDEQAAIRKDFGGDEAFNGLLQWAGDNLAAKDVEFFNTQVNKDAAASRMAVEWLDGKRKAVEGFPPEVTIKGGVSNAQSQDVYRSMKEVSRDMSARDANGRVMYKNDPAYRDKVKAKLARSDVG